MVFVLFVALSALRQRRAAAPAEGAVEEGPRSSRAKRKAEDAST
jgi:hypothetical protein